MAILACRNIAIPHEAGFKECFEKKTPFYLLIEQYPTIIPRSIVSRNLFPPSDTLNYDNTIVHS